MKKFNLRPFLFVFAFTLSLFSYIFINTVDNSPSDWYPTTEQEAASESSDRLNADGKDVNLPDVQLMKKLLEKGTLLLPAS